MHDSGQAPRGRGAASNPANRFEKLHIEWDPPDEALREEGDGDSRPALKTEFLKDASKSIVTRNDSPDIGFEFSVNPYRGCEHGCAYCYARPTHEYLGFSAGLDFESRILVKENAPALLREKLMSKSWEPAVIAMSGVTDCYQPAERRFRLTRGCLEVLNEFHNPAVLITKNALVTRDLDVLRQMASFQGILVFISVTTLDSELCGVLEPRTSRPSARLDAIRQLTEAGVPVGVLVAPCIPGLTDHEMPSILKAAAEAGAVQAGFTPVRLPLAVRPLFEEWLDRHRPERKDKVLANVRSLRGGNLNDPRFGSRMTGEGATADALAGLFRITCRRLGLNREKVRLSTETFRRPGDQLSLF